MFKNLTIMKRFYLLISLVIPACGIMMAQGPRHDMHQRSAEECALKQTQMMVHELHIKDTAQYRAIFDMHLKYARLREGGCSRAQMMTYMEQSNEELKNILTKEQYDAYMNRQFQPGPHHQQPVGRFAGPGKEGPQSHHPHKGHPQCPPDSVRPSKPGCNN